MKVSFNPAVSFRQNLIEQRVSAQQAQTGLPKDEVEISTKVSPNEEFQEVSKKGKIDEYLTESKQTDSDKQKPELFQEALHSREWKKEYLPESDIIAIQNKKIKDDVEYMIEKDGTVKECGLNIKPTVIIEPSVEGAKEFGKLKVKLSGEEDKTQKSLWYKMKNGVANIWKFFQVTSTMAAATTKGLAEGVVTGAGVLASAMLIRGGYKKIVNKVPFKELAATPFKTAGKTGILLSAVAGATVLAAEVIAGRMKANQQSAVIEHKLDVAHDLG